MDYCFVFVRIIFLFKRRGRDKSRWDNIQAAATATVGGVNQMEKEKSPLGLVILGGINFFIFGIAAFFFSLFLYFNLSVQTWETVLNLVKDKNVVLPITYQQFKIALVVQSMIAVVFLITGWGLLKKKEWARKTTIYFSFSMAAAIFFMVLFNPALIKPALGQIIYPSLLFLYFSSKRTGEVFKNK